MQTKNRLLLVLLSSGLLPLITYGSEPSAFSFKSSFSSTSDDLHLRTFQLEARNNRRAPSYPFEGAQREALDYGLRYEAHDGSSVDESAKQQTIMPFLGLKKNKFYMEGGAGFTNSQLDGSSAQFNSFFANGSYTDEDIYLEGSLGNHSVFSALRFPKALEQDLRSHETKLSGIWSPGSWWFRFLARHERLSDDNVANYQDVELKRNFSSGKIWFLAGAGVENYRNSEDVDGYWTPEKFSSIGPRVEATIPIFEKYVFSGAINYNFFQDENGDRGEGHYLNLFFQSDQRNNSNIRIGYERIKSAQGSNTWFLNRPYIDWRYYW